MTKYSFGFRVMLIEVNIVIGISSELLDQMCHEF